MEMTRTKTPPWRPTLGAVDTVPRSSACGPQILPRSGALLLRLDLPLNLGLGLRAECHEGLLLRLRLPLALGSGLRLLGDDLGLSLGLDPQRVLLLAEEVVEALVERRHL